MKKDELAAEMSGQVRGAARRLLRQTHRLVRVSRKLPVVTMLDPLSKQYQHITLPLPAPTDDTAAEIAALRARVERAEQAAAWLRARLRAERSRTALRLRLDAAGVSADLTRELSKLYGAHPDVVRRIVTRVLAAHGMPIGADGAAPAGERAPVPALTAWTREQQEALGAQIVARVPDVADPIYVYRALAALALRGRLTLPTLTRAIELESPMARRRLRLAVEALAACGALTVREGVYALNTAYQPAPAGGTTSQCAGDVSVPRRDCARQPRR